MFALSVFTSCSLDFQLRKRGQTRVRRKWSGQLVPSSLSSLAHFEPAKTNATSSSAKCAMTRRFEETAPLRAGRIWEIGRASVGKEGRSRWSPYHLKKK